MPYFKVREVIANDTGNVDESAVGRTDIEADNWLQQEAAEAAALLNSEENKLLGHWAYDGDRKLFLIDKTSAGFLGIEDYHEPVTAEQIISRLNSFDASRFNLNMNEDSMGDIVYEHCTMTQGPCKGKSFIVQGSVLLRNPDGTALYAVGFISHENSPHSELIPREISGDGMYIWDSTTDELVCSASYHAMIGYKEEEFPHYLEDFVLRIVHPDDNDFFMVLSQMCLTDQYGDYFESCMRIRHKDGHYIWSICRGLVQERDATGKARRVIGTQTNINLVQSSFDNIKLMMFTDSLTGLHNRNYFMQNYRRYEETFAQPVSVIFIDISGLKLTNDILGHSHGDYLLIKARDLIREGIAKSSYSPDQALDAINKAEHDLATKSLVSITPTTVDYLAAKEKAANEAHNSATTTTAAAQSATAQASATTTTQAATTQAATTQAPTTQAATTQAATSAPSATSPASESPASASTSSACTDTATNSSSKPVASVCTSACPCEANGVAATPNLANLASDSCDPNVPDIKAANAAADAAAAARSADRTASENTAATASESSRSENPSLATDATWTRNLSESRQNSAQVDTLNSISERHAASEPKIANSSDEAEKAEAQARKSELDSTDDLMEILRLAGDEFLVILPCCDEAKVAEIAQNIDKLREENNTYHEEHTALDSRPVPIFFGIGYATYHGRQASDITLKQVINQADELMQIDKDNRREEFYSKLKQFFELKKGRPVSMRDDRRVTILSEEEREQLRQRRLNNLMF